MSERVASVSVSDIVRTAQISRSSFYAHFSSLDQVATDFLRAQFAEIESSAAELRREDLITGTQAARIGYRRLVAHIVEHYPLYSSVLDLPLTRTAFDEIVEVYSSRLLESIVGLAYVPPGVQPELLASYVAGGTLTSINSWMRGQIDVSDDELVEQLVAFLPTWLVESRA